MRSEGMRSENMGRKNMGREDMGDEKIAVCDIGGTKIKSALWNGRELTGEKETDTQAWQGGKAILCRVEELLSSMGAFDAVGISTAGQVNPLDGSILYANSNIPGYTGMAVGRRLEERFGVPAAVENDVNAAALGEGYCGAGAGHKDFLCITYGTGVGGAIVTGGRLYRGSGFSSGEFGGIVTHPEAVRENEPYSGCYERYASTTALVERMKTYDGQLNNGRLIFAQLENPQVRQIVDEWIEEVLHGLVTLIHIFDPSCVILGGGIMAQKYILDQIRQKIGRRLIPSFAGVQISPAGLGNRAGLMGAVCIAEERLRRESYAE